MLVDFGGGTPNTKAPGHINVDTVSTADIVLNLDNPHLKLPFEDNSLSGCRAHQFIEHIENIIPFMNEAFRVMKPDALLEISTPKGGTDPWYQDPTHKRGYVWETFLYFVKDSQFADAQIEYGITARFQHDFEHWMENGWNLQIRLKK